MIPVRRGTAGKGPLAGHSLLSTRFSEDPFSPLCFGHGNSGVGASDGGLLVISVVSGEFVGLGRFQFLRRLPGQTWRDSRQQTQPKHRNCRRAGVRGACSGCAACVERGKGSGGRASKDRELPVLARRCCSDRIAFEQYIPVDHHQPAEDQPQVPHGGQGVHSQRSVGGRQLDPGNKARGPDR